MTGTIGWRSRRHRCKAVVIVFDVLNLGAEAGVTGARYCHSSKGTSPYQQPCTLCTGNETLTTTLQRAVTSVLLPCSFLSYDHYYLACLRGISISISIRILISFFLTNFTWFNFISCFVFLDNLFPLKLDLKTNNKNTGSFYKRAPFECENHFFRHIFWKADSYKQ